MQISDEYIDRLLMLMENVRDNQFSIGDTLVELVDLHPGQRTDVMKYVAGKLAMASSTLYDYENTSRRWSPEKRLEYAALDYTIYRNSDPIENKDLLDKCVEEGWNATTFKEKMYPELVSPANMVRRVLNLLDKMLKCDMPYYIESRICPIIDEFKEMYDLLDDEF